MLTESDSVLPSGGFVTPATLTLNESPAFTLPGTTKVTVASEFVSVGVTETDPLPDELVTSAIE